VTERQLDILRWLSLREQAQTPAQIAHGIGMTPVHGGRGQGGRGKGHRVFNPAQRIISSLTSLHRQGLIDQVQRPDGLSGVAYWATDEGVKQAR